MGWKAKGFRTFPFGTETCGDGDGGMENLAWNLGPRGKQRGAVPDLGFGSSPSTGGALEFASWGQRARKEGGARGLKRGDVGTGRRTRNRKEAPATAWDFLFRY